METKTVYVLCCVSYNHNYKSGYHENVLCAMRKKLDMFVKILHTGNLRRLNQTIFIDFSSHHIRRTANPYRKSPGELVCEMSPCSRLSGLYDCLALL